MKVTLQGDSGKCELVFELSKTNRKLKQIQSCSENYEPKLEAISKIYIDDKHSIFDYLQVLFCCLESTIANPLGNWTS